MEVQAADAVASSFSGDCRCRCGAVRFCVTAPPISRFYCHCLICQRVYGRAFGDPTVTWKARVRLEDPDRVAFARQRAFPFAVRCGTCRSCGSPVVGYSRVAPFVTLAYVPSSAYVRSSDVPEAAGHVFYATRRCDADDDLPKLHGFAASQLGVARFVLGGLLGAGAQP